MEALLKPVSTEIELPSRPPRQRSLGDLSAALEARVPGTGAHSRRVARYATGLARQIELPRELIARIRGAAAVHDIGKLEMPAEIVNKPGPLSAEEFAIVKRHSQAGARIVARLGHGELAPIVRHHHERFDGSGYPDGLAGEEIPLGARIVAVADTFDAVTSPRPYRAAERDSEAMALLRDEAGAHLDPELVEAFRDYFSGPRTALLRVLAR
jgi:HD-GYP domain-containing protein (c-di-GMP phosphodiesterase class II)